MTQAAQYAVCSCFCIPQMRRIARKLIGVMGLFWLSGVSLASDCRQLTVDFDHAMQGVNFDLAGDHNGADGGNGIPDATEMALVAAIIGNPSLDFSKSGGVSHKAVCEAYQTGLAHAKDDVTMLSMIWRTTPDVVVGYSMLGKASHTRIKDMVAGFGSTLEEDYSLLLTLERFLSADVDADGDGISNVAEYRGAGEKRPAYIKAALDPNIKVSKGVKAAASMPTAKKLQLGILLYPGFEVLDVFGPLEMWGYVEEFQIVLVAEKAGPVMSAQQVAVVATHSYSSAPALDILMVPGGMGTFQQLANESTLEFIRKADKTTRFTSSVCTGSALLAKAGVLNGQRATTNKRFFFLSESQSSKVQWIPTARWVESGKYFTSSGVSAGTDMALGLVAKVKGIESAKELASAVEYEWQPDSTRDPFAEFVKHQSAQASGDALLQKSEPAEKQVLAASPRYIALYFNKAPAVVESHIELFSSTGKSIPLRAKHTMGNNDLMALLTESLPPGSYEVRWKARFTNEDSSKDQQGSYQFVVGM